MTHSFPTRRSSDLEGLSSKKKCVFLSSKVTDREKIELFNLNEKKFNSLFVNPALLYDTPNEKSLDDTLKQIASYLSDTQNDERSEEHTSELQSLMRISYAVF